MGRKLRHAVRAKKTLALEKCRLRLLNVDVCLGWWDLDSFRVLVNDGFVAWDVVMFMRQRVSRAVGIAAVVVVAVAHTCAVTDITVLLLPIGRNEKEEPPRTTTLIIICSASVNNYL